MRYENIFESYDEYQESRWVHYSDHEMLTINPKQFHQDPFGIYFFPESHVPTATMWHQKKYKYVVVLKQDARVLDLPEISDNELNKMLVGMGVKDEFEGYIKQYPPKDRIKKIDMAWERLRAGGGFRYSLWNKVIRNLGYDALFDDKGVVHSSEPIQLIVLNPRCINVVDRIVIKSDYFRKMLKIFEEIQKLATNYGNVTTEPPKIVSRYGNKSLAAYIRINDYDHKPYATITLSRNDDKNWRHLVDVSVSSDPKLSFGLGAKYDTLKDAWQDGHESLNTIKYGLDKIFSADENTPRNNYGGII